MERTERGIMETVQIQFMLPGAVYYFIRVVIFWEVCVTGFGSGGFHF